MATLSFTVDTRTPLLDKAGVEAARLRLAARDSLVAANKSVTYELLASARDHTEAATRQWVRRLRERGRLITVEYANTTLIPSFQFDDDYEPDPSVGRAVETLTRAGMAGWAVWRWFCVVSPWIDDMPVNLIADGRTDELEKLAIQFVADSTEG